MFTRVLRSPDGVDGGAAPAATAAMGGDTHATSTGEGARATELPIGGVDGMWSDLRTRHKAWQRGNQITDDGVRGMLTDCCNFLRQLMYITSNVIETFGVGQVREIVAAEMPVPPRVIREDGTYIDVDTPARADHRKNPRGRKHPVITLIQMALQGVRLILQITTGIYPGAHNKETLEEKKLKEEAKQAEKSFRALLKG